MKICPICSQENPDKAKKCIRCEGEFPGVKNPENPPLSPLNNLNTNKNQEDPPVITLDDLNTKIEAPKKVKKGLGGLLILLGFGLVMTPFLILKTISDTHIPLINDGSLSLLIHPESPDYIEWFFPLVIFELMSNIALILFSLFLIFLFFGKHQLFPRLYVIFLFSSLLIFIADQILPDLIPALAAIPDTEDYSHEGFKLFLQVIGWTSYIYRSVRVKNTFVETSFKIRIPPVIITLLLSIGCVTVLSALEGGKFSFDEQAYATQVCQEFAGEYSIYSGKKDEEGQYLCDCEDGFDFGGEDESQCIPADETSENPSGMDTESSHISQSRG